MNTLGRLKATLLLLIVALSLALPTTAIAQDTDRRAGDDVCGEFKITITPQDNGDLIIKYEFNNYTAGIDYPAGVPYTVGAAERNFEVIEGEWGSSNGVVVDVKNNGNSQVELQLDHTIQAGENWSMWFSIRQHRMAYDQGDQGISLEFKNPYWPGGENDFFYAENFSVIWNYGDKIPTKFEPMPTSNIDGVAEYRWENVRLNSQFAAMMVWFPREAMPNLDAANVVPESEVYSGGGDPVPATPSSDSSELSLGELCCWGIVILLILLAVGYIIWALVRMSDGSPREHYGGSISRPSIDPVVYLGEVAENVSDILDDVTSCASCARSGGGGGGGGGGGRSCACACAGCACACAGGGR